MLFIDDKGEVRENRPVYQITPEHAREVALDEARGMLSELESLAPRAPELGPLAERLAGLLDREADFHAAVRDAEAEVSAARARRDRAEREAIADGRDPHTAAKRAEAELSKAQTARETAVRHHLAVHALVVDAAREAEPPYRQARRKTAPARLREALRAAEAARREAVEGVHGVVAACDEVASLMMSVNHLAIEPGLEDDEVASLAAHAGVSTHSARAGADAPTWARLLDLMRELADLRLQYTATFGAMPLAIAPEVGQAVALLQAEDADHADER